MRYADPSLCPDCRSVLPHGAGTCPTCSLPVRHPLAVELFATLTRADALVQQLRSLGPDAVPGPAPATASPPRAPSARAVPAAPALPTAAPAPAPYAGGLGVAAVPRILLGLGALCLLVAAVVFLAVSWSWLGVGGRTGVLVSLTVLAAAAALLLHRFELRIAAEALSVVALGLLGLDLLGADAAGWFGGLSTGAVVGVAGLAAALAGTGLALPRPAGRPRLVAPQVIAGLGALVAWAGVAAETSHDLLAGHLLVAVAGGAAVLCRRPLPVQAWALTGAAAWVWAATTLLALSVALSEPALGATWLDNGAGWSLLVSSAALLVPGAVLRHRDLTLAAGSLAALLATTAVTLPCVDESVAVLGLVALLVTAAWTLAHRLLPHLLRVVAVAPAAAGSLLLLGLASVTATVAAGRVAATGWDRPLGVLLDGPDAVTEPLLTVPSALLPLLLAAQLLRAHTGTGPVSRTTWWAAGGVVGGLAGVATLASYDVPLVSVVAALLTLAGGALAVGLLTTGARRTGAGTAGLGVALAAVAAGLPSPAVLAVAAAGALVVAATAHGLGRSATLAFAGGPLLAPVAVLLVWSAGRANEVDAALLGVPALAVLGLLVLVRPRPEVELPAALVAPVAALPAVAAATDAGGSLALHLTVAGSLVVAQALVHATRRPLAWAGAGLLLLATWVRLGDLGVSAPEPYTLPLAVGLVVVGLVHLRRQPQASTANALLPGLLLGTVPSLVWVLEDPLTTRALLLGAGCLALTIAGAALRWSAPLVVGSAVGAVLVLREIGPYAGEVPQWVWIGLAGALLTTVGITWERRLLELRRAVGLLGRLR